MSPAAYAERRLNEFAEPDRVPALRRFFKTGPGEYGEGDEFLGIRVPSIRKLSKELRDLPLNDTLALLRSPVHEARLLALLILVEQYRRGDEKLRKRIFDAYLANTRSINSWDLVDSSAEHIVGAYLQNRSRSTLQALARSDLIWERRIAVLATFHYIKQGEYAEALEIARSLLNDEEDLIQKAVGWMLREVGKRDPAVEEAFLQEYYQRMPRTMLRYAIERFAPERRRAYLKGSV